jgi:hypothetical protein
MVVPTANAFLGKPENCVRFFQLAWAMRARARMFSPSCCATVLSSRAGGEALDVAGEEFQVHCEGLVAFCEPFKAFVYGHGVQSFAGWHALHGVGLWEALFGWPPFLTSDNGYYVN